MDFEQFKESLAADVKEQIYERFGAEVSVEARTTDKLNESYEALTVKLEDDNIGVNLNVNQLYKELQRGNNSFDEIVAKAADIAWNALENRPDFNLDVLTDYSKMKDTLAMEVVSSERNAELLETVPHKNIEDMAVVYRFVINSYDDGRSSILVTNKMLDNYGVTAEQLHADAMAIAPEVRPAIIQGLSEVMAEMMGAEHAEMLGLTPSPDEPIFVATVQDKTQGAGIIAYENFMDQAAERIGGDFYILPSSIHEILLVRDDGNFDKNSLEKMVVEVNATTVDPADKLTDNVYHYDSKEKVFELAEKFEARSRDAKEAAPKEKGSLMAELKAKKEEVAKTPKKDAPSVAPKSKGGEAK